MNSNSIFLTRNDIKVGSAVSLPAIIRLVQNRSDNVGSSNYAKLIDRRTEQAGNMGDRFFDFAMDFTCLPYQSFTGGNNSVYNDTFSHDPFYTINQILSTKTSPTFTNKFFTDNYIVLEITDYGHQSMSPGFRDFVPWVFINGKKIWQRYIGVIRQYSKHAAFLIIHKNNNLQKSSISDSDIIDIRIIFKNNIEDRNISNTNDPANGQLTKELSRRDEVGYYVFTGDISDFQYLSMDTFEDYDLFYKEDTYLKRIITPYDSIKIIIEDKDIDTNNANINKQNGETGKEYYRQSYVHDYAGDKGQVTYARNISKKITLRLSKKFYKFDDSVTKLIIRSRQNSYNAVYSNDYSSISAEGGKILPHKSMSDINIFKKDGSRVYTTNAQEEYEFIPEFTSRFKSVMNINNIGNSLNVKNILYSIDAYSLRDYSDSPNDEYIAYDANGSLKRFGNASTINLKDVSSLELYTSFSRNVTGNSVSESLTKNSSITMKYTTPDLSDDLGELGKTDEYTEISFTNNTVNITPRELIYIGSNIDSFDVYAICRCFPVIFEKRMIYPNVYRLSYPEWMFMTDSGKTRVDTFYVMEPYIHIKKNDNSSIGKFYYRADKIGNELGSETISDINNSSGSMNVFNCEESETLKNIIKVG